MPVDFLTDDLVASYGRFAGPPSQPELERLFFFDDGDRALVATPRPGVRLALVAGVTGNILPEFFGQPAGMTEQISVDAWIGYHWRIDQRRVLDLQLRAQDLQSDGGYRAIAANADGNHAVYSIVPPRRYYLTATLKF